jgi:hypothetical protein
MSLHAFTSAWYFCRLITALSLSNYNKSLSSTSMGHDLAPGIARELLCLISSVVAASAPNNNWNGEKFVALATDVL